MKKRTVTGYLPKTGKPWKDERLDVWRKRFDKSDWSATEWPPVKVRVTIEEAGA